MDYTYKISINIRLLAITLSESVYQVHIVHKSSVLEVHTEGLCDLYLNKIKNDNGNEKKRIHSFFSVQISVGFDSLC